VDLVLLSPAVKERGVRRGEERIRSEEERRGEERRRETRRGEERRREEKRGEERREERKGGGKIKMPDEAEIWPEENKKKQ
jgi:hypothetical protein